MWGRYEFFVARCGEAGVAGQMHRVCMEKDHVPLYNSTALCLARLVWRSRL